MYLHNFSKCVVCVDAKFAKKPLLSIEHRKSELLELIHSDLAGFRNTISRGRKKYYISFIDDFSRYTRIYILKTKDEAAEIFPKYKTEVENQLNRKIRRIRLDIGGEYNTAFRFP